MKTTLVTLSALLAATMLLSGCSAYNRLTGKQVTTVKQTGEVKTETPTQTYAAATTVLPGEWTLVSVGQQVVTGDERPYLIFEPDGSNPFIFKVYGNNGCNVINGGVAVTADGGIHKTAPFATTMRYCPDAPYEIGMTTALESMTRYTLTEVGEDYTLTLSNATGSQTMTLLRSGLSFLNGAWTVTAIGDRTLASDAGVQMVIDIPELKVHGNTGCNIFNGQILLDPDINGGIQFRNLGVTRMACPDPQTQQSFLVAIEEVISASHQPDGLIYLNDEHGQHVLTLERLQLRPEDTAAE